MPTNTYVALDKITLGTATSTITFSSIPQTYTDLVMVFDGTAASATYSGIRFNGDTGNNYSYTYLAGNGSTAVSSRSSNNPEMYTSTGNTVTTSQNNTIVHIQNYSNTSTFKTALIRNNSTTVETTAAVGLWRNTAAITSVTFKTPGTNFAAGSTFSLYGISAIGGVTPKATGGTVTSDGTYYYHAFEMSGNFVPNQSLSCDYLVVAGGGGGCMGGGGAGGLKTGSAFSVTAQSYPITVGAGGVGGNHPSTNGSNGSNSVFSSITSTGGGGGGKGDTNGLAGGSGGGGGGNGSATSTGGAASPSGQGNTGGGNGGFLGAPYSGGGGGGSGAVGGNATANNIAGNGGAGTASSYSGTSITYAGGGGGSMSTVAGGTAGTGGTGGGANGSTTTTGVSAIANLGGGGGGAAGVSTGGSGGSGIVIIRYAV
jgi:hypothetical protein